MTCVLLELPRYVALNKLEKIMTTKPIDPTIENEIKDPSLKYNLSKFEYDLFHDEDDIAERIIRVKRYSLPNNGERWKVFENDKVMFIIEGTKLTKKEKSFLRSIDGVNFLIGMYKTGINSFNHFKIEIRNKINNAS